MQFRNEESLGVDGAKLAPIALTGAAVSVVVANGEGGKALLNIE